VLGPLPGGALCGALHLAWNGFELAQVGTEGSAGGFSDVDVRPVNIRPTRPWRGQWREIDLAWRRDIG
jgi:hypothetical protein